eukprot:5326001-Pleurochrysis_carterae.AAC.2
MMLSAYLILVAAVRSGGELEFLLTCFFERTLFLSSLCAEKVKLDFPMLDDFVARLASSPRSDGQEKFSDPRK